MADVVSFDQRARLDAAALEIWRGRRRLLHRFGFSVSAGQLGRLTGPNGSGKTSLLRVLLGLALPEQGEIRWTGVSIRDNVNFRQAVAYVGHTSGVTGNLSARENLRHAASLMATAPRTDIHVALARVGLDRLGKRPAATFSAGQRRRLAMARLLLSPAQLWVLDEPLTNLDAAGVELVETLIRAHLACNGIVIAASHQAIDCGPHAVVPLELAA